MQRRLFMTIALCCAVFARAQKPAEAGIISDNDLYTSTKNDRYYTNGIEFFYRYLGNSKNDNVAKKITEFRIGQYMYNPQSVHADKINVNDRPFAGYLFAEAGINRFYRNEDVLKMNLQLGVVGPAALGRQLQELIHTVFGYDKVKGWQYQITNTPGVQANIFYSKKVFSAENKKTDFHLLADVNAGTIWTGASIGATARISFKRDLLAMYDSSLYGASVNRDPAAYKEQREFYLYLSPSLNYQLYDATIQGSLFNDDSPVTFPLIPFRFNAEVGLKYRRNKWNFSYSFNYRGKELSNNVIVGYFYGSISAGYLLY